MFTVEEACLVVIDVQGKLATIVDESETVIGTCSKACTGDAGTRNTSSVA